jgi:hypothetical protein
MEYSKGPWKWEDDKLLDKNGDAVIGIFPAYGDKKAWLIVNAGGKNDGGNQTLIAAAPDMYEALSLIYKIHCEDAFRLADKDYIAITKAAAALALAEGRSTE